MTVRPDEPTDVYRAYSDTGELLYVGIARKWASRWAQHATSSSFYPLVRRLQVETLPDRQKALALESKLIAKHQPRYNVRGVSVRREPLCEACGKEDSYSLSWRQLPAHEQPPCPWADDTFRTYTFSELVALAAEEDGTPSTSWPVGRWRLTGNCTADTEMYYVLYRRAGGDGILESPRAFKNWVRHLRGKSWFDEQDFDSVLRRYLALGGASRFRFPELSAIAGWGS